ncbi:transposase [Pelomonas sp. V22]|nr:transposase [Pelomonas sp. V22]
MQTSLRFEPSSEHARRRAFLEEKGRLVPWSVRVALISASKPEGRRGLSPFAVEVKPRIHFIRQWFHRSGPTMEESLRDIAPFRGFSGLGDWDEQMPDGTTALRFRRVLEKHKRGSRCLR